MVKLNLITELVFINVYSTQTVYLLESSSFFVRFLELAPRFRFARLIKDERVSLGLQPGSGADAALERPGTFSRRSWQPMSLTSNVPRSQNTFTLYNHNLLCSKSSVNLFSTSYLPSVFTYTFRCKLIFVLGISTNGMVCCVRWGLVCKTSPIQVQQTNFRPQTFTILPADYHKLKSPVSKVTNDICWQIKISFINLPTMLFKKQQDRENL